MPVLYDEFPPRFSLPELLAQNPLPRLTPGILDLTAMVDDVPTKQAQIVLDSLNAAIAKNDMKALEDCFLED